ncbi:ImmA/IrrE family metallo-endopeptidase [Saxibacter everestensis]|uniref:ImmA/IrrE family metallo-endopeptidase n=1 Tax=Saxibacter everestensis TaxID=2909229 RepID=A0ABY8QWD1_9MICO|nr:ImmA/IrrE family metallo-endopeptidase [Brevibacteriaceae bacterium ZFBP1038]
MPDGDTRHGCTNGVDTIWLDDRLLYEERRCALQHELIHLERGDVGRQSAHVEAEIRAETARRLIGWNDLVYAMSWGCSMQEVAIELAVTVDVLEDRLDGLRPAVRAMLCRAKDQLA